MLTLQDLVSNRSITDNGADVLRTIGAAGHPFLVYALPRNAGKSTLVEAILGTAAPDLPRHEFFGTEAEVTSLCASPAHGYLLVAEIGHRGRPGYLAGDEVGRVFQLVAHGYSLASSLHADSVDEVFDVLRRNGVATADAATIPYLVKVRALGSPDSPSTPRVVEQIHEIAPNGTDTPGRKLLYEWDGEVSA
ncbi:MAG TPA: hypothetical protein VHX59_02560 [Mycobacteriales bacterium]|nr:hypothetical protein [Mycobacteriales bacterium]